MESAGLGLGPTPATALAEELDSERWSPLAPSRAPAAFFERPALAAAACVRRQSGPRSLFSSLPHPARAEKLIVILRDGRKIVGILRSFDQFGERAGTGTTLQEALGSGLAPRFSSHSVSFSRRLPGQPTS